MHVHELDIMNWAMGGHPVMVTATGGRLTRTEAKYGDVYDHFSAEYEYANGVRALYMGRQMDGCSNRCGERIVGTKGICVTDWANSIIEGEKAYGYEGKMPDPCLRQHREQIEAIRSGGKLNEGKRVAESTLTAIMGRMSAYTGRSLKWDWVLKASKLDLGLSEYKLGDLPEWEIQRPGKSQLV
jgi:predicted dehydrogenase